jgi:hypothetical protein
MSHMEPSPVTCPRCQVVWSTALFTSVDADTVQVQVDAILAGQFEQRTCPGCGAAFQPEHGLLFASHARRLWIVMLPASERTRYATLERGVADIVNANVARAAPAVAERLAGIAPRLVFGQHMLAEAVRVAYAGLDAPLVECAKLLAVRRNLAALIGHGPFELCVERFDGDAPICAIHALPSGERVAEFALTGDVLDEARAAQPVMQDQFPDLFQCPYVSATRYLLGDTV